MEKTKQLIDYIRNSQRILIVSHISPDPDAVASTLLMGETLKLNFKDKKVEMLIEEKPARDLSFLNGYSDIRFKSLISSLESFKPDLLIIVDANTFDRVSRNDGSAIQACVHKNGIKVAVVDHHQLEGADKVDITINNKCPATAEEVYVLCFEGLNLQKPKGYAEITLLGIVSDTERHKFDHPGYRETFRITSELLDAGASIEKLENKLDRYTKAQLSVLAHLAENITDTGQGYTYSFISDKFIDDWETSKQSVDDLKNGIEIFVDQFIRNFEGNSWGFVVYRDLVSKDDIYGVSLRSMSGATDVSRLANKLGGGGHIPAAGAKIAAKNVNEAIERVQEVISIG